MNRVPLCYERGTCYPLFMETQKITDRKAYLKQKKKEHRQKNRTVSVSYPNSIADQMEQEAEKHDLKLAAYIKHCVASYREKSYLLPSSSEAERIEILLRNYGNNINQIARKCNTSELHPTEGIEQVYALLRKLEQELDDLFRSPRDLTEYTRQALEENPRYASALLNVLSVYIRALCS